MRYEDASGAFQASGPVANDDADTLAAGSRGPATGNLITGEGTQYGAAGADSAAGAHVAAIAGQGGEDSSFAGGKLSVSGQYGSLSVDAEGNYSYMANKGAPENVRDRFTYTLADNQGNTDTAALIVELGKTPAVIKADAQQIVPGPDGVVTLPPGVELSDIMVVGRNLVVNMPDGTQLIIVDGAVFVPQLSLGGVEVPATNVAALLVGQEVQPAAGETPPSSGGNFALPPPPLDPGVPLGDLLPPTEYDYIPPDPQEVFDILDEEPEIFVQPDGQPASIAAVDQVEEAGLPTRNGNLPNEPAGSGESADGNGADNDVTSEATTGTIIINSPDGIDSVTITGADGIPREIVVGLVVQGQFGALTITGIVGDDYTYSYVLRDNTSGNDTHDDFSVVLTDDDGDQAAATLRIDIIDDVPTARNDTDASVNGVATGNVMTDAAAGDLGDTDTNAADTVGADNATLTAVSGTGGSDSTFSGGLLNVNGTFGSLAIDAQGNYTYTVNPNAGGGGVDVFTYTLTDGDGDTTTATLTITNPDLAPNLPDPALIRLDDDVIPGAGGNPDGPNDDDPDVVGQNSVNGQLAGTGGDGDLDYAFTGSNTLPAGFTVNVVNAGQVQILQGGTVVMTITLNNETGAFTVVQNAPIDHPSLDGLAGDNTENNLDFSIGVQVVDVDGDVEPGAITINVDDDTPVVNTQVQLGGTVDEDGVLEGADDNGDGDGNPGGVNDVPGESTVVQGNVSALFSPGADQPLTFSLLTDTSGLPQGLTSNGAPVTYSVVGNTLTASANGQPVFTLTVNGTTGEYTFTLLDQLDHPSQDGIEGDDDTENLVDLTLALGSIIQATDADGDSVVAPANGLVITVDDDSPLPFEDCPDDVITVNQVGSTFTGNLNLPPVGADEPGIVSFVVEDGDPVLDNEGNPVTSEGSELFYFVNDAGVLEARAGDATGDVIFTVTLNGDGTFTYEQVGVFGEGSEFTFDDLTSSAAGNVEFRGVGADDPATTVDLLLSAGPGDGVTVNTDSDSIGSANQSMDIGETVRIDLVNDLTTGAGTPSGFGYGAHVSSSSFIGLIPQVQGSQDQTVAFTVWALDSSNTQGSEPDRDPAGGFSDASITAVTSVTVKDYLTGESTTVDVTGFTVGTFTAVAYGISARVNADGSVTFSGIQQGDSYGFSTGSGDFNAVVVRSEPAGTGGSTQDSYDLGIFSIGIANEFDPFGLSIPIALTDSDGDAVVCDIDVNVGVPLDAPEITVTVNEAGLPLIGSDAASNSEIASGDLQGQVSGGTGPYTFTLVSNGNGAFGTLVLNADGTFTYTLDTPFDSQPDADDGTNPELGAETFTFEATDSLGATQTGTITVNIIDDVPTAVVDTDSIAAGQYGPATGNVITDASLGDAGDSDTGADTKGADGATVVGVAAGNTGADLDNPATVGVVIQGAYGKLTLNTDGSYSYVRDPGTDGGVQDVFTYTIEDGDGDRSNATLTISIADSPPTIDAPDDGEAGTEVNEKGLPARPGEPEGSGEQAAAGANGDPSETTTGVITFTAPDGPAIVRIDGVVVTGAVNQTFVGSHGTLTITSYDAATGQIGYSYTLTDNTSGDATFDDFAIQVEDQDGDIANDTLVVDIIDDVPTANPDVDSVVGGFDPATGNVLTGSEVAVGEDTNGSDGVADVTGADGGRITNIDHAASPAEAVPNGGSTDIQGTYGVLTIYSNGDYSYQRDPGTPGGVNDVFTYTLTDGDGDTTTTTLTIGIDDNFPQAGNVNVQLDDDALAGGNPGGTGDVDPDTSGTGGNLPGTGGDAPLTFSVLLTGEPAGFDYVSGGAGIVLIQQGGETKITVTVNSDGSYTVVQNNPIDHPAGGNENDVGPLVVNYTVSDADSDTANGTITINVDDDTPTVTASTTQPTLAVDETDLAANAGPTSFAGVFTASFGADGQAAVNPSVYTLGINAGVTGIVDTATGQAVVLSMNGGVVEGRTSGSNDLVFTVTVDGSGNVTLDQLRAVVHNDPADHDESGLSAVTLANDNMITLTRTITDGDSDSASATADIGRNLQFEDDGPDAVNDSANQATENTPVNIDVHANDFDGADDVNLATGIQVVGGSLTGTGSLIYNGDGTFTYTLGAGEEGSVQFQYRLTDRDGDSDVATVTINLQPDSTPSAVDGVAKVDDDGLSAGVGDSASGDLNANDGEAPVVNASEAVWHGQLSATAGGDTIVDYDFASMHGQNGVVGTENVIYSWDNALSKLTATTVGGTRPGTELFNVVVNQGNGSYNLTLVNNVLHADEVANQENDASTTLTFTVTDSDGDPDTGQIVVTFDDDMPVVTAVTDPLEIENSGATPTGTGSFAFDIGADQNADFDDISVSNFSILINGNPASNVVLTPNVDGGGNPAPETATTASYRFTFQYDTGVGGVTNGVGTLVFNKATGEYTVTLESGPIEGFTILETGSDTTTFVEFDLNGGAPDVVTAQLATNLFAQFTAVSTNNNGTPNLLTTGGNNIAWNPGELFTADPGNPQVSSTDAGVDGNTMDTGEVLDFDLFTSNPGSNTALTPDGFATEMFIQFFQFAANDDIIVILKLQDADNPAITTTRAILIDSEDVFLDGDSAAGTSYEGLVNGLGSQDALVVIQSNDYNAAGENWVIVGAQIVTDNDGTTGTGVDLDGDLGASGASDRDGDGTFEDLGGAADEQDTFADDTDVSGLKITSIGFLVPSTEAQSATIEFDVTVEDSDGDQVVTQDVTVQIGDPPADALAATSFMAQDEQLQKTAANSNSLTMATAVAAAGMADSAAAAPTADPAVMRTADVTEAGSAAGSAELSADDGQGGNNIVAAMPEAEEADAGPGNSPGRGRGHDNAEAAKLDAGSNQQSSDEGSSHQAANDQGPAVNAEPQVAVAPTVMMASAEQLQAAGLSGEAKQGGAVEKIVAEALGGGDAPTVDGLLAHLPGGIQALAHVASQDAGSVPGWDMAAHGAFGGGNDMLIKVDVISNHHDALQPAVNG